MSDPPVLKGFSFDLSGRTVLVTGASSGIGRHFAKILAASGARLVLAARRIALLDELRADIAGAGGESIAVAMDVADEASTIAAYDAAQDAFGPLDSVIANAGTSSPGSALGLAIEEFDRIVAVNLRGVFLTVREGARRMIAAGSSERGHGRIVIISSITANHISPGLAVYSATKAGISQMARVLARDWVNKGVNVNTICPGYMRTELTGPLLELKSGAKMVADFPRRRVMDTNALDAMLLFLASDSSAQTTGSIFTIDDGQTL